MDRTADVTSIESLRDLRSALVQFGADSKDAIVMLTLESRKAIHWLVHDRARYWPDQVRKAQDRLVQARNELERCQLRYGSEEAPSCFEQKKAFERARARLRLCEEKVRQVKRWIVTVQEELDEFEGELAKLGNYAETDLPRAVAALERMIRALDKYAGDYQSLANVTGTDAPIASSPTSVEPDDQKSADRSDESADRN